MVNTPKTGEGKQLKAYKYRPSALVADHERNASKSCLYATPPELAKHLGKKCCYTLEQIEARLRSLKRASQIENITIYITNTQVGNVVIGFLRHAAFLLAEVRGELDQIPDANEMVRCTKVRQPKNPADWLRLAEKNFEENTSRQDMTPVDKATYLHRLTSALADGGYGLTPEQAADKFGADKRTVARYLRVLNHNPTEIAKLHAGEITMAALFKKSKDSGEAGGRGKRPGLSVAGMRKALDHTATRGCPTTAMTCEQQLVYLACIAGRPPEKVPEEVKAWIAFISPPKSLGKKSPRKKAATNKPKPDTN